MKREADRVLAEVRRKISDVEKHLEVSSPNTSAECSGPFAACGVSPFRSVHLKFYDPFDVEVMTGGVAVPAVCT